MAAASFDDPGVVGLLSTESVHFNAQAETELMAKSKRRTLCSTALAPASQSFTEMVLQKIRNFEY